jgi:hypothetical protein
MSDGGIGKVGTAFGVMGIGQGLRDLSESTSTGSFFNNMKNVMVQTGSTFGPRWMQAVSIKNDSTNLVMSMKDKDVKGMVTSGTSFVSNTMLLFPKTTPLGLFIQGNSMLFQEVYRIESERPGSLDNFFRSGRGFGE